MPGLKDTCPTLTTAKKHVREILSSYTDGSIIDNQLIIDLMAHHPTKPIEKERLEYLKYKKTPPYYKLGIYYKHKDMETEDDISWHLAIRNLYGKYNEERQSIDKVMRALRFEIGTGTKSSFFLSNTTDTNDGREAECANCRKQLHPPDICVDHYPIPFKKILEDFIQNESLELNRLEIYECDNVLKLKDSELAERWRRYHDDKARYRILCNSCNSSFGSYGY